MVALVPVVIPRPRIQAMSVSANEPLMSVNGVDPVGQPLRAGPAGTGAGAAGAGAAGGAAGVAAIVADAVPVPTLLMAETRNV